MNKKKPRRKDNPKKKQNPISPPITSTQNKKLVWIVSFHITGKERIWAIRSGERVFLLWWDPNHEIYPSPKKHT